LEKKEERRGERVGLEKKEERRKLRKKISKKFKNSSLLSPLARQLDRVPLHVPDPGDQAVVLLREGVLQGVAALVEERLDL